MSHHFRQRALQLAAVFAGFMICLYGCSSSYSVSSEGKPNSEYSYRELNEELKGRNVTIEMKDGEEFDSEEGAISGDSISWVNAGEPHSLAMATRNVKTLTFKNHWIGGLEGLWITAPSIFAGTWGMGGFSREGIGGSQGWELPAALGAIGGGIGMIVGAVIGHSYDYEFPSTLQSDSLQSRK